ncbi:MAG: hypothetical protein N2036_08640 [Bryobacteraceae bacterium]|nr:hypothetical protein [Bryobacteraceae bacterium]MCX7604129.1 hypothetical protein [Bryobacteraceae bacterium]
MFRFFLSFLICLPLLPMAAQDAISVDELIEKHIAAMGGREAMSKVSSLVMTGSFELPAMGASGTITIYQKAPNKRLAVINIDGFGEIYQGFDGERGFSVSPMGSIDMSGQMLEDAKRDAVFHPELRLKELYPKIEVKGKGKVNGRDAWIVSMTPEKGNPVTAYFDAETFLMVKNSAVRMTDQGEAEIESEFGEFREVAGTGVRAPHLIKQKMPIGEIILRITEIKPNAEIPDSRFAKP